MKKVNTSLSNMLWYFLLLLEGNIIPPGLIKVRKFDGIARRAGDVWDSTVMSFSFVR